MSTVSDKEVHTDFVTPWDPFLQSAVTRTPGQKRTCVEVGCTKVDRRGSLFFLGLNRPRRRGLLDSRD